MREKLAESLKEFNQWVDLIRSGEAEVTGLTVTRKNKWVGLTDEEVADIERNSITRRQAIRAIEAKLKERNT
jgi:hypothetical protein